MEGDSLELLIAIIQVLPIVIPALITVCVSIWGAYKQIKAQKYKEAFILTEDALAGMIIGIEAIPMSETQRASIKAHLNNIAKELHTEGPKVAEMVQDLQELMSRLGVKSSDDSVGTAFRATEVLNAYKEKKKREQK